MPGSLIRLCIYPSYLSSTCPDLSVLSRPWKHLKRSVDMQLKLSWALACELQSHLERKIKTWRAEDWSKRGEKGDKGRQTLLTGPWTRREMSICLSWAVEGSRYAVCQLMVAQCAQVSMLTITQTQRCKCLNADVQQIRKRDCHRRWTPTGAYRSSMFASKKNCIYFLAVSFVDTEIRHFTPHT